MPTQQGPKQHALDGAHHCVKAALGTPSPAKTACRHSSSSSSRVHVNARGGVQPVTEHVRRPGLDADPLS